MIEDSNSTTREKTVTLDTLFSNLNNLKLLKIDAEGMEEKILSGSRQLIKRTRPTLFVENDRVTKSESLINEVYNQGYRAFWHVSKMHNPSNFNDVNENIFGNIHSINMICFPNGSRLNLRGFTEIKDPKYHPMSKSAR